MHCHEILRYNLMFHLINWRLKYDTYFYLVPNSWKLHSHSDLLHQMSCLGLRQVVYEIMHKQEVFQPFKNHPRFDELVENIYTVCFMYFILIILQYTFAL